MSIIGFNDLNHNGRVYLTKVFHKNVRITIFQSSEIILICLRVFQDDSKSFHSKSTNYILKSTNYLGQLSHCHCIMMLTNVVLFNLANSYKYTQSQTHAFKTNTPVFNVVLDFLYKHSLLKYAFCSKYFLLILPKKLLLCK